MSIPPQQALEIARANHFLGSRLTQISLRVLIWIAIANVNLWMFFGILSLTDVFPFFEVLEVELFDWIFLLIFWGVAIWGLFELTRWKRRALYILGAALIVYQLLTLFAVSPLFGASGWLGFLIGLAVLFFLGRSAGHLFE